MQREAEAEAKSEAESKRAGMEICLSHDRQAGRGGPAADPTLVCAHVVWVWGPLLGGSFVFVVVILFFISIALSALSLSHSSGASAVALLLDSTTHTQPHRTRTSITSIRRWPLQQGQPQPRTWQLVGCRLINS